MFEKPKVFEKEVEDHLKDAFKSSYRWKGVSREDMLKHNTIKATTIKWKSDFLIWIFFVRILQSF